MIALSERMQAVPASPIRKLAPLARAAARRGVHVLHLNIGQPYIKTPTQALAAIHRMEQPILSYSPSEGNLSLRGKLSSYYAGFGISLSNVTISLCDTLELPSILASATVSSSTKLSMKSV